MRASVFPFTLPYPQRSRLMTASSTSVATFTAGPLSPSTAARNAVTSRARSRSCACSDSGGTPREANPIAVSLPS